MRLVPKTVLQACQHLETLLAKGLHLMRIQRQVTRVKKRRHPSLLLRPNPQSAVISDAAIDRAVRPRQARAAMVWSTRSVRRGSSTRPASQPPAKPPK
jgi:hypothetical protein